MHASERETWFPSHCPSKSWCGTSLRVRDVEFEGLVTVVVNSSVSLGYNVVKLTDVSEEYVSLFRLEE